MRSTDWLPPLAWMVVIMGLSSDAGSAEHTGRILVPLIHMAWPTATPPQVDALHALARKGAHFAEYAILAALWFRAFVRGRGHRAGAAGWLAWLICVGWAGLDELHQSFVESRTGSLGDVAIDTTGATVAMIVGRLGWRAAAHVATTVLLWTSALGGGVLLAVNGALGVPSGALWLTTPAAVIVILARRRRRSVV